MPTPDDLFAEAERQLNICNSCRYCEGYCAVFPALERRTVLETGDITQLASLCHDCRACFQACMYAPPHEFAVDPPTILTAVRQASYRHYLPSPGWLRPGWLRPAWRDAGGAPGQRRPSVSAPPCWPWSRSPKASARCCATAARIRSSLTRRCS